MNMKVFFVLDALINAGTERSVLEIVSNFSADIKVTVLYFYDRHDLKVDFEKAGIDVVFFNLKSNKSFFQGAKCLKNYIQKEKPNLVVSSIYRANIISRLVCKLTNTPLIGTFISDSYGAERTSNYNWKRKLGALYYYYIDKFTAGIPCAYISNSESIKKSNCKYLGIESRKVQVIYRGRDPKKISPWTMPNHSDNFDFIFTGRLIESKGLIELIHAFENVNAQYPHTRLNIYGAGPLKSFLIELIAEKKLNNVVSFGGVVSNVIDQLHQANCYVFPSWFEGFSGSLVEAMMCGIPIVASDITMNKEAIENNVDGLLHKSKNIEHLASCMTLALKEYDRMCLLGKNARNKALALYDIKLISRQYEQFIMNCNFSK